MPINVEFFGIPRARTGTAEVQLLEGHATATLGEVLAQLSEQFPEFAADCVRDGELATGFIASLDGNRFLQDANAVISTGSTLLILSSDAGG